MSPLEAALSLKGVIWAGFVSAWRRGAAWKHGQARAPAGDSLQALAESFPAGLLVPLEAVGRPRWNVLGSRNCEPKESQCWPGLVILPDTLIHFLLPSHTHLFGGHDVSFVCCFVFVLFSVFVVIETGPYPVAQDGLKPTVILALVS